MKRLDAHQHFWSLDNFFTNWPTSDLAPIYRDFGPSDLAPILGQADIAGTILVQAAPSIAETRHLLDLANVTDFVEGVVGWIDFEAADAADTLAQLAEHPKLKAVRPMVQSIDDPNWLLRSDFSPIFRLMATRGLVLDGLVRSDQIGQLATLARLYPNLQIVLDHCGKPPIARGHLAPWADDINDLASSPNVACKLSGLWTEAGTDISIAAIRPWVDHVLSAFGPERLIWGSDWPVIQLVGDYADWVRQCDALLRGLSQGQRDGIFGGNGRRIYGIR